VLIATLVNLLRLAMPEATAEDWIKQNKLRQEWLAVNPDAQYIGWTSI
jgi:hypothetical protein